MKIQKPLKRSLTGLEIELFTIDRQGKIVNAADSILNKAKKDNKLVLKKENSFSMIEIASYPNEMVPDTMKHLLEELEYATKITKKMDVLLCPLGLYPGKFDPTMRNDLKYEIKKSIFGKQKYKIEARCAGFHCHYTLPRGIFDSQIRALKLIISSKIKDGFVNSYNMMIAADPALACFMQSSPFYQGKYLGKDSRIIMYRGGEALNNNAGLYADFEEFGGLPHYKSTTLDIMDLITTRFQKWKSYIKSMGLNIKVLSLYGSTLYTTWGPVRISPHGTLEQSGMDMNHPKYIVGMGVLIKFILKRLQEEHYVVIPSEIGIKEPFKVEGDVIYIPPYTYLRNDLQRLSAYKGFDSDIIYNYCRRFLKFAASTMPKDRLRLISPLNNMLKERKTISDEIIDYAKKRGFKKNDRGISNKLAAEISLSHSERLIKEIEEAKRLINSYLD